MAIPIRNEELVWRDEPAEKEKIISALESGEEDAAEQGWVIIIEGGEMHQLNLIAGEMWLLFDGVRTDEEVANLLAKEYEAPLEEILEDVRAFMGGCVQRGWITIGE